MLRTKDTNLTLQDYTSSTVVQGEIAAENKGRYFSLSQRQLLVENLQADLSPEYCLRIKIMLLADTGHSQSQVCAYLGCSKETARYWIAMTQAGQTHRWNDCFKGRPSIINEQFLHRLQELVKHDPRKYGYSFSRWTGQWLAKHLTKELNITVSPSYINILLKEMGLSASQRKN